MTTRCAEGGAHSFLVEDATGAHCPEHGITLLRHDHVPSHEGDRMTTHTAQADGGKHGGQPSDKPWVPDPQPAPSPDGNRPQKRTEQ
ncbi:hypothetical protein [Streptomyces griseus]|uniref:hypothetical protein n=1 Tax=Streptomyces griseus TaxID=1911 RepID=UPI0033AA50E6